MFNLLDFCPVKFFRINKLLHVFFFLQVHIYVKENLVGIQFSQPGGLSNFVDQKSYRSTCILVLLVVSRHIFFLKINLFAGFYSELV